jgi:hypothetical protein
MVALDRWSDRSGRRLAFVSVRKVITMTSTETNLDQSLEIFIEELVTDEEFRAAFLRNPWKTVCLAREWGVPLSESEICALAGTARSTWESVAERLQGRLLEAA